MTCDVARAAMLTAEAADLDGSRESTLSGHLRECPACRARAALLLEAQRTLGDGLQAAAAGAIAPATQLIAQVAQRRRRRVRRARRLMPLAAAVLLAGLWWFRRAPLPSGATVVPTRMPHSGVTVTAPPGRNVAILDAGRADIVVIWFF